MQKACSNCDHADPTYGPLVSIEVPEALARPGFAHWPAPERAQVARRIRHVLVDSQRRLNPEAFSLDTITSLKVYRKSLTSARGA